MAPKGLAHRRPGRLVALGALALLSCVMAWSRLTPRPLSADDDTSHQVFLPLLLHGGDAPSSYDLIDDALQRGKLDAETALIYKVYVVFADNRLPTQYNGDDSHLEDTGIGGEVVAQLDSVSPAAQTLLAPFLMPPAYAGSWYEQRDGAVAPAPDFQPICNDLAADWGFVFSANGQVKVWWHEDYPGDMAKANTIAQAIDSLIWPKLSGLMSRAPATDRLVSCNGSDERLDIYLTDGLAEVINGEAWPYQGCDNTPAYLLIKRSLEGNKLLAVVVHELMHAFQFAYDVQAGCADYRWLMEATAKWAEDFVYPDFNTEHPRASDYLTVPEVSLESTTPDGHAYGAYLWFFYLARALGQPPLVGTIWHNTLQASSLQAIDQAIPEGFGQRWPEFTTYNWNQPPADEYRQWDQIEPGAATRTGALIAVTLGGSPDREIEVAANGVPHLAARYYHLVFPDDEARSVTFYNGLHWRLSKQPALDPGVGISPGTVFSWDVIPYEQQQHAHIVAIAKYEGQEWAEPEDWSGLPVKSFCRDRTAERLEELVLIYSNSAHADTSYQLQPQGLEPTLWVTNIGCWRWQGETTYTFESAGITKRIEAQVTWERLVGAEYASSAIVFQVRPGSTAHWSIAGSLGVCTYSGSRTVQLEPDPSLFYLYDKVVAGPGHRGYSGSGVSEAIVTTTVTCPPEAGGIYTFEGPVGVWFAPPGHLSDEPFWKAVQPDGDIADTHSKFEGTITQNWEFEPLRE